MWFLRYFPQIRAVGVNHCCGVVEESCLLLFIHRQNQDHVELLGERHETLGSGPLWDCFGVSVVLGVLHLAEVRTVEQLLETHDLRPLSGGLSGIFLVEVDHGFFVACPLCLDDGGSYGPAHNCLVSELVDSTRS